MDDLETLWAAYLVLLGDERTQELAKKVYGRIQELRWMQSLVPSEAVPVQSINTRRLSA